ncbi:hypothetical protein Q1695_011855 [Nippostrongylus brasiliensis]|nr:hypothetical protein Q1695_011855 [Nippostrongylus brasiliensis]
MFSVIRRRLLSAGATCTMWTVSQEGQIRVHFSTPSTSSESPTLSSICVPGCMQSISAGVSGVVWALAKDGTAYTLSPDFSLLSGTVANQFTQKTEVVKKVTEYQKYAFLRGFTSFQGASNGVTAWMGGYRAVSGLYTRLPSREWMWIDPTWSLVDADKYEEGWTYAESIDGSFSVPKNKKDRVRRRCWQRRSRYEGRGPWIAVESPPIRSLDIQKTKGDRTLLWAVTRDRQVLLRQGVTEGHPQGTTWKHIVSDFDIAEISVASPTCVWAITCEGRLLRRQCLDQTDMECIDWSEVVYSPMRSFFTFCATTNIVFLLPATDPHLLVYDAKKGKKLSVETYIIPTGPRTPLFQKR